MPGNQISGLTDFEKQLDLILRVVTTFSCHHRRVHSLRLPRIQAFEWHKTTGRAVRMRRAAFGLALRRFYERGHTNTRRSSHSPTIHTSDGIPVQLPMQLIAAPSAGLGTARERKNRVRRAAAHEGFLARLSTVANERIPRKQPTTGINHQDINFKPKGHPP